MVRNNIHYIHPIRRRTSHIKPLQTSRLCLFRLIKATMFLYHVSFFRYWIAKCSNSGHFPSVIAFIINEDSWNAMPHVLLKCLSYCSWTKGINTSINFGIQIIYLSAINPRMFFYCVCVDHPVPRRSCPFDITSFTDNP